eukprot:7391987-Prymnesium_polylepis.3
MAEEEFSALLEDGPRCLERAALIGSQLAASVYASEFDGRLRDELRGLADDTEKRAAQLLGAWRGMCCRNAILVEYNPLLTGLVRSNTAPLMLGAGQSGKAAGMYMCKYMVKEAYELASSLSILVDARKHIKDYGSVADDAGAPDRVAKHFLQRVLNTAAAELSSTQAAGMCLGVSSSSHSHAFANAYVWDAIRLTRVGRAGGALLSEATVELDDDDVPGGGVEDGGDDDGDGGDGDEGDEDEAVPAAAAAAAATDDDGADPVQDHGESLAGGRRGTASVYSLPDGGKVALAQADHYAWRAAELNSMNYAEFVMGMKIVKLTSAELEKVRGAKDIMAALNSSHDGAGRPRARSYAFRKGHPLRETYVLRQRSKYEVPVLVGDAPPKAPPNTSTPLRRRKAAAHA